MKSLEIFACASFLQLNRTLDDNGAITDDSYKNNIRPIGIGNIQL